MTFTKQVVCIYSSYGCTWGATPTLPPIMPAAHVTATAMLLVMLMLGGCMLCHSLLLPVSPLWPCCSLCHGCVLCCGLLLPTSPPLPHCSSCCHWAVACCAVVCCCPCRHCSCAAHHVMVVCHAAACCCPHCCHGHATCH